MSKVLITSGCSFTETTELDTNNWKTWPIHLYKILENHGYTKFINCAMGSQGNGLISRGIIYNVCKALETYDSEDILVGIMWSSSNRMDYRCTSPDLLSFGNTNTDGWIENPTSFVDGASKNWVIMNAGWTNEESQTYYKYFHDFTGSTIYSIEHILRTQYFLQAKGIKYFFTDFTDNNIVDKTSADYALFQKEIDYLYNLIDFDHYLPVSSEHRWVYENSKTKEEFYEKHFFNGRRASWIHPNREQHKEFVENIVYPHIVSKSLI